AESTGIRTQASKAPMNTQTKKKRQTDPPPKPSLGERLSFSLWPVIACVASVLFYLFHARLHALLPGVQTVTLHNIAAITIFYSFSWLMARSFRALILHRRTGSGRRKAPKLLTELVSVTLFTISTML